MNLFWIHIKDMLSALKIFMRGSRWGMGKPLKFYAAVYRGGGGVLTNFFYYDIHYTCMSEILSWKGPKFPENNGIGIFW